LDREILPIEHRVNEEDFKPPRRFELKSNIEKGSKRVTISSRFDIDPNDRLHIEIFTTRRYIRGRFIHRLKRSCLGSTFHTVVCEFIQNRNENKVHSDDRLCITVNTWWSAFKP